MSHCYLLESVIKHVFPCRLQAYQAQVFPLWFPSMNDRSTANTFIRHLFVLLTEKQCSLCQGQCSRRSWLESPRLSRSGQCCSARIHKPLLLLQPCCICRSFLPSAETAWVRRQRGKQRVNRQRRHAGQQTFFVCEWDFLLCFSRGWSIFFGFSVFTFLVCMYCGTSVSLYRH